MTADLTTLANGLRVVTHHMPHLATSSLGVWVGAGSRHESEAEHGVCHLLEHMAFKGTATRSAQAIVEEIEAVGGELNATTDFEMTAYFARVLGGDESVALAILADILQNSLFGAGELVREKEVILQEIAGYADSPDDIADDLIIDAAFPKQALGRPIIGTPASVQRLTASNLKGVLEAHYHPGNMVISGAGALRHEDVLRHAEALFGGLIGTRQITGPKAVYSGGARASKKSFEQCHVALGYEGPSRRDDDYFTALVLSGLFGGGMSSRLFQEVRERRGLCYAIYSSVWGLEDTGMFTVQAATGAGMMDELVNVIAAEFRKMVEKGPMAAEVARSKAQLKAGLLMSFESSAARAEQMARQVLTRGRVIPADELVQKVDAVMPEDVCALTGRLVRGSPSAAVVGAGRGSMKFAECATRMLAS